MIQGTARMRDLLATRERDHSLPQPFYNDPEFFRLDMEHIFGRQWLFAALTCDIATPGSYVTLTVGNDSVIIVRDRGGAVQAFHNSCRHRGARICNNDKGRAAKLVCPYHQWTYELDGRLLHAGHMGEGFDASRFRLKPVAVEVIGGYIFICLSDTPPSIADYRQAVEPYLLPHDIDNCKVAFENTLVEKANWKLVIENNRECYHCRGSHPELLRTLSEYDDVNDPRLDPKYRAILESAGARWSSQGLPHGPTPHSLRWRAVRLPLLPGQLSMTMDGQLASRKLLGGITDPDLGSVRMLSLPNSWNHLMSDHIIAFRVIPVGPQETLVTTKWLVHKDAVEGVDYDVKRLTEVWDATNRQDRHLAEVNQLGINSSAYQPGPYSPDIEFGVQSFIDWYTGEMATALGNQASLAVAAE